MSSEFKDGDMVRVLDATFMSRLNVGDVVKVDYVDGPFLRLVGYEGGWYAHRFELVEPDPVPEPEMFAVGSIASNGAVNILRDGATYPSHEEAYEIAKSIVDRGQVGTRTIAVLKVVTEFRRVIETKEVRHGV